MNIGIVVGFFPKISETFVLDQITGLIDRGHNVNIIANKGKEDINHLEVDSYKLLNNTTYYDDPDTLVNELIGNLIIAVQLSVQHPSCLVRVLKKDAFGFFKIEPFLDAEFDILHSHFGPVSILPASLKEWGVIDVPLVVSFHGYGVRQGKERGEDIYTEVFNQADIILANSEATRDALIEFGADRSQIRIHRIGIDLSRFSYRTPIQKTPTPETHIVSVGRLTEEKGHKDAIRAVKQLKEDNPSLDITYKIVGGGELETELQGLVEELGMRDTIVLLGRQPREVVVQELAGADLYLHPSYSEGLGISLLEAQASGLPIVATRVGGIPEAVCEGESALLVDPGDIDGLQNNLQTLLDNPGKRVRMAKRGREFVEEHYDNSKLTDELVEIYKSIYNW